MSDKFIQRFLDAVRSVAGPEPTGLHVPDFHGREREFLLECLDSTFVSSVGPFVDRFEREIEAYTGAKHAVAVVNGTAALHIALLLAGVQPGDEVLIPALTFVATANAVHYCGAIPHFVDIESVRLGVDASRLSEYLAQTAHRRANVWVNRHTGRVLRALVPMHTFGHPSEMEELIAVATEYNLRLVEDAAESLGSFYRERHTGTLGLLGTLSFNGNKIITTGGGGMILTNDSELARQAKHLTTTAKVPHRWHFIHDKVGFNYRMPNINAALGCAQLERLSSFLAAKRNLFANYQKAFEDMPEVRLISEPSDSKSNYWLQTALIEFGSETMRDEILAATNDAGFTTRPAWRLLHKLQPFLDCPRMSLGCAEKIERCLVNLPSSAQLGEKVRA